MAAVSYEWAVSVDGEDWTVVETEDDDTFAVTADLVGMYVKVTVTAEDGETASDVTTEPVGVYEELEILSAEQTGANTVLLTFSDDVTALDDIDVFKGSKEVAVDDIDYIDDTAVVTLTNKIVGDAEYTVTLTPANGDPATSASFVGEKAAVGEIVFLNNVLVMADTTYTKGYAYVKGYDQFGNEIALTGLNVTPGVGTFTGYDIDTGRVTIEDQTNGQTGVFLLMKEVPVFAQYQQGNEVISGQATLTVSTQSYVSEVEFGEVAKDGGDMRADGRITLSELGSGKYYVPFETIRDQYGNDLDADTLNTQKNGDAQGNKTLFVIPAANGAFYSTGNFGTIGEKTVLWLGAGANAKPGSMDLTLVGAGGGTFATPITIEDDPFIDSLSVSYPELYENDDVTEELEFSAIDQYGEDIDLWTFRPTVINDANGNPTILQFGDENNMTQIKTNITATGAEFNKVDLDYTTKTFKVTLKVTGAARTLATFTTTTAGMQVTPVSINIGQRGEGAKVKSSLKSGTDTQLAPAARGKNNKVAFNKVVQFEDANGRAMVRGESPDYPQFLGAFTTGDTILGYDSKLNYTKFYWTLSSNKVEKHEDNTQTPAVALDPDGTYTYVDAQNNGYDVYVTLYAAVGPQTTGAGKYYLVDDQDFHLTSVMGDDKSYSVALKDALWASKDSNDTVSATVTATTDLGETYTVAGGRLKITSGLFTNTTDTLDGKLAADINPSAGTENVTVYVDPWTNGALTGSKKPADSVTLTYTDAKPVAKAAWAKYYTTKAANGIPTTLVGDDFDDAFTGARLTLDGSNSTVTVAATGIMTITFGNGLADTITLGVDDNYGQHMTDSKFYLDGVLMTPATATIPVGQDHTLEVRNGAQSKMIYVDVENTAVTTTVAATTSSIAFTGNLVAGTNAITVTAAKVGTLWAMTNAEFTAFKEGGVEPTAKAGVINLGAAAAGTTTPITWNITNNQAVTANTAYQLVLTDGDGAIQAQKSVKTAAAILTTVTLGAVTLNANNSSSAAVGLADQFGGAISAATVTIEKALAETAASNPGTANDGNTATATSASWTAGTLSWTNAYGTTGSASTASLTQEFKIVSGTKQTTITVTYQNATQTGGANGNATATAVTNVTA